MKMKFIFKNLWVVALAFLWVSCNESEDLVTANALEGGLLEPSATNLNYVVGNSGPYPVEFFVNQSPDISITSIAVFNSFSGFDVYQAVDESDSLVSYTTNEVAFRTVSVTETSSHFLSFDVNYDELIAGLTREDRSTTDHLVSAGGVGGVLPSADVDLVIGDTWNLRFELTLSDGRVVQPSFTVKLTFSTRFAGTYNVTEGVYYRIQVRRDDVGWPEQMSIASVDATTYEQIEYFGAFDGNTLYFVIDPADNTIDYPAEFGGVAQTGNGQPLTTCALNPTDLTNVPCGADTNIAIANDDTGEDQLIMTYGYLTGGSGPREFYQILTKAL